MPRHPNDERGIWGDDMHHPCWVRTYGSRGPPPTSGASSPSPSCSRVACRVTAISDRVRSGRLHAMHCGVYAVGHRGLTLEGSFLAAVSACGRARSSATARLPCCGASAGTSATPRSRFATGPRTTRMASPEGRLALDELNRHHGIPITTPARTLLDLATTLDDKPLRTATRRDQASYRVNVCPLPDALARHRGRRGTRLARRSSPPDPRRRRASSRTAYSTSSCAAATYTPTSTSHSTSTAPTWSPTPAGPQQRLVVEADGRRGTTTRSRARTTPSARPCWRPTASGSCASRGRRRSRDHAHARQAPRGGAPYTERPMISTNQFKNGNHIEVDGTVFKILEFQHVKPGKGGAFVRTKLRRASDGTVIDKTFRAGEKFRSGPHRGAQDEVPLLRRHRRPLHGHRVLRADGGARGDVAEALRWTQPNEEVDVLFIDGDPSDLQLPASVELEVSETEPGLRGDTASGGGDKPATLETGAKITSRCSSTSATA